MPPTASVNKLQQGRGAPSIRAVPVLIAVVAALYFARELFIPLAFAVTLALILSPAVAWLRKLRMSRVAAAMTVALVSIVAAAMISFVIFDQIVQVLNAVPSYRENIHNKLQALRAPSTGALGRAAENVMELGRELSNSQPPTGAPASVPSDNVPPIIGPPVNVPPPILPPAILPPAIPPPASLPAVQQTSGPNTQPEPARPLPVQVIDKPANELEYLRNLTTPFIGPLATLGMVLIFTVFLLIEQDGLRNRLFRLAGLNRLSLLTQALDDATQRVSRYLMLQFGVNASFGILFGIGLYVIGVPYAALWGTVTAILRIVPYIGSPAAGSLPLLLSLAVFDGWKPPMLVFLLFVILELVTANMIEPWLYGTQTGISSLALLVTAVFWTTLWGAPGLVLSTPLTVCLVVLGRHVPQFSFLQILLGDETVLDSEAQLYQRLVAMDESGSRLVMDRYLDKNPMTQLYDAVMIPALTLVERDRHDGALEPDREEFIYLTMREMLSDLAERKRKSGLAASSLLKPLPMGRVLSIPATHESDEIAGAMLAQLLEPAGLATIVLPLNPNNMQLLEVIAPEENDIFCVSALPPLAFSGARSLTTHLRQRFPKTKIVVALWGSNADTDRSMQRFQPFPPDKVVTSLVSAVDWMVAEEARRTDAQADAEIVST